MRYHADFEVKSELLPWWCVMLDGNMDVSWWLLMLDENMDVLHVA
jgi:hypothetical protein